MTYLSAEQDPKRRKTDKHRSSGTMKWFPKEIREEKSQLEQDDEREKYHS